MMPAADRQAPQGRITTVKRQPRRGTLTRPLEATARELTPGVWCIAVESKSAPGVMHEIKVAHGRANTCDCEAASYRVFCRHRRDAEVLAGALDTALGASACIRDEQAHYGPGSAQRISHWRMELDFSRAIVRALGYRLTRMEAAA